MAKVCIAEKCTDCDGVLFVEGLVKCDSIKGYWGSCGLRRVWVSLWQYVLL